MHIDPWLVEALTEDKGNEMCIFPENSLEGIIQATGDHFVKMNGDLDYAVTDPECMLL